MERRAIGPSIKYVTLNWQFLTPHQIPIPQSYKYHTFVDHPEEGCHEFMSPTPIARGGEISRGPLKNERSIIFIFFVVITY